MPTRRKLLKKDEVDELLKELEKEYPDAGCELEFDSVYHLLIAVVLSAQTTDVSVNKVTPKLFSKYRRPEDLAAADINDVIETIKQIGLY
ncbi:MAG: endonuclease III, partial [Mogibacterium sp.]|nr:endonuclease III [Mogibacterium sp.]